MRVIHSMRAGLLGITALAAAQAPGAPPVSSNYTIFIHAVPIGSEQVALERSNDGWTITSSGRMGAPIDLVSRTVEARYTTEWKPIELTIDATLQGQPLLDHTAVTGITAVSDVTQAGRSSQLTVTIAADAVMLPNPFFGPYEALAERLRTAPAGSTIPAYLLQASGQIQVGESSEEMIQTPARVIHARRTLIKIVVPNVAPLDVEVWGEESGHLLRLAVPAQSLEVVREDIASVAARRVVVSRAGDEQVRAAANGFTLAATVSKPVANPGGKPFPAVILVSGAGPTDRDETIAGIPIFGQLANALADAGFLVVRYDKRGVGQSGGRPEAAALDDYSDDLRAVIKLAADRKDVDRKRLAVAGYDDGGVVAMLTASKDSRVGALALVETIGVTGAESNLYQVTHQLDRANRPSAEKQATIDLQKRIQNAVITGSGWEGIQPAVRQQADTPWFQSFLAFDPAKVMASVDQPVLIVEGELDTQVPAANADRLEELAGERKKSRPVEAVRLPGINHLLVPATTGEPDEYAELKDKHVSPAVPQAIAAWLKKTLPAPK